jgi:MFS transporter, Spinster family, sphingosine-1-phosphate transporter
MISENKLYQVGKHQAAFLLVVLSLLMLLDYAARGILNISLDAIKADFGLTDAQAGMLPSLLQLGIALFTLPAAMLADRIARRRVIMFMALVWSIFSIVTAMVTQFWQLAVSRFMVGTGEAGYGPAGTTWIGVAFPKEKRSRVIGVFMSCFPLGTVLAAIVGGVLLTTTHDWRIGFYVFGIPGIILAFAVLFLKDYGVSKQEGEAIFSRQYFRDWGGLFRSRSYVLFVIASIFLYWLVFATLSWVAVLIMRVYNVDAMTAGLIIAGVNLLALLGPLGGLMSDAWQKRNPCGRPLFAIVAIGLLIASLFITLLTAGAVPLPVWVAIYCLVGLLQAFTIPAFMTLPHDVTPVEVRSTAIGMQTLVAQLTGGVCGPLLVGVISDALGGGAAGIQWGLIWSIIIGAFSLIFLILMLRSYPSESSQTSDAVQAER